MNVCIIGWYGTETMGDRAILDGIVDVFGKVYGRVSFSIGSLFPFYTNRTLFEDKKIFLSNAKEALFDVFDIKNKIQRKEYIKKADLLIFGGGPLMDLEELYIMEDCFSLAKKAGIKAYVFGCGVGPLKNEEYIKQVYGIFKNSEKIALRDVNSVELCKQLYGDEFEYKLMGDPAVISVEKYKQRENDVNKGDIVAVNFRDFPTGEYGKCDCFSYEMLCDLVRKLSDSYEIVELIPMHTFFIGGDDREFITKICFDADCKNVKVIHKPMNLHELYHEYMCAKACVGMRYHSVVMQTILNGNNYILDYTDPNKGKISGFIKALDGHEFYDNRIVNMQETCEGNKLSKICDVLSENRVYEYKKSRIEEDYCSFIS